MSKSSAAAPTFRRAHPPSRSARAHSSGAARGCTQRTLISFDPWCIWCIWCIWHLVLKMYTSSIAFATTAAIGCGFLMCTASLLSLKHRAYEIKRREERTKIVFGALQVAASLFGSWMLTERNKRLDASIDTIEEHHMPKLSKRRPPSRESTKRKRAARRRQSPPTP